MKKIIALILTLTLFICNATAALAAAGQKTGYTTLTAAVPEPDYTIHVPANMSLEYGSTHDKELGSVYISDAVNISTSVQCAISGTALKNGSNYIAVNYSWKRAGDENSWFFKTVSGESVVMCRDTLYASNTYTTLNINAQVPDWASAVPGTYTATITYNFSIAD